MVFLILFFQLVVSKSCAISLGCDCTIYNSCVELGGTCKCICEDGCNLTNLRGYRVCSNISKSHPQMKIIYPCDDITNTKCFYNYATVDDGIYCPHKCVYKNGKCKDANDKVCEPYKTWVCPNGCNYNVTTHKCNPLTSTAICEVNKSTKCPDGCIYYSSGVYNTKGTPMCIGEIQNSICGLEYKLVCPYGCKLNHLGPINPPDLNPKSNLCIPAIDGYVCNITRHLPCQDGYTPYKGYCIPSFERYGPYLAITEPMVSLKCLHDTYLYGSTEIVDSYTCQGNLCFFDDKSGKRLIYPLRLKGKYKNIMCKYSNSECDSKFLTECCV